MAERRRTQNCDTLANIVLGRTHLEGLIMLKRGTVKMPGQDEEGKTKKRKEDLRYFLLKKCAYDRLNKLKELKSIIKDSFENVVCPICHQYFSKRIHIADHLEVKSNIFSTTEPFQGLTCPQEEDGMCLLDFQEYLKLLYCKPCDKIYATDQAFARHQKTH